MRALGTLLKLAQSRMDDLGREAVRLGVEINTLRSNKDNFDARLKDEIAFAAGDIEMMLMAPAFRRRMTDEAARLGAEVADREAALAAIKEQLSAAYREKSKLEQLIEADRARRASARAAVEMAQLDEAAVLRAGRN